MAGPGGIEADRVTVRVLPDTSLFARSLQRYLQRIERTTIVRLPTALDVDGATEDLQMLRARVEKTRAQLGVDVDAGTAAEQVDRVARDRTAHVKVDVDRSSLARVAGVLGGLNGSLGALAPGKVALLSTALASAAFSAGNLAAALVPAVGALGVLPAAGFAGAAAIGTLTIGLQGVGDAMKAVAEGDAEKLAEAMKGLAPAAQDTVRAVKGMVPAFRDLKRSVQQNLFTDVAENVKGLGSVYLPILKTEFSGIASILSGGFTGTAGSLLEPATVESLRRSLGNVREAFARLQDVGYDLTQAFAPLTEVGSTFLPGLADGLAQAAFKFGGFIREAAKTGDLKQWIGAGLTAVGQLAQLAGEAAQAIFGIVSAAQSVGGGSIAGILTMVRGLSDVINSAAGQGALQSIFGGVAEGFAALSTAVGPLGEVFAALAPVIGTVAAQVGGVLAAAVKALAPTLVALAPALGDIAVVLGQALVRGLQVAGPLLARFAQYLAENRPALIAVGVAAAALTGPVGLVAAAIAGLIVLWREWGPQISSVASQISDRLQPVFTTFAAAAESLWPALQGLGQALAGWATTVLPIVQQVAAVFVEQWPQISATVSSVFQSVVSIIRSVMVIVTALITQATGTIRAVWDSGFGKAILAITSGALTGTLTFIRGAFQVVSGLFQTIAAVMTGDWSGAWDGIKRIVSGAVTVVVGVVKGLNTAVSGTLSALGDIALDAVKGFGSMLVDAGRALIQGLIDGVVSMLGPVADAVGKVASVVKDHFPGSPVKTGPLTSWNNGGAGKRLGAMLADGLGDTRSVEAAARSLAASVTSGFQVSASPRLSVSGPATFAPSAGGPSVVFTGNIIARDEDAVMVAAQARLVDAQTYAGLRDVAVIG